MDDVAGADSTRQLRDLKRRLDALERENTYLRAVQRLEGKAAIAIGQFVFLIVAGRSLSFGLRNLFTTWQETGRLSLVDSAEVVAAVVRRAFRIGVVALFLTLLPTWLLWHQNQLISEQNLYFRRQTDKLQEQIASEELNTRVARRAALLSTIYDTGNCDRRARGQACPPMANVRSRAEAVTAFVQLERSSGVRHVDLSNANLEGANLNEGGLADARLDHAVLRGADLELADLARAVLSDADLAGADLAGADLGGADLTRASLVDARANEAADFSEATLRGTDLGGAFLRTARFDRAILAGASLARADLYHATLRGADLSGADLSAARHLDAADLTDAHYDDRTRWPAGFDPPKAGARRID